MMLSITIPGREPIELAHLVCDLNGTLALDGALLTGVTERITQLSSSLTIHVLTADTHGGLPQVIAQLSSACKMAGNPAPRGERIGTGSEKERYVAQLGAAQVVAIGNGTNDERMFRAAALSIGVIGVEGASVPTLLAAHVITASPLDALDLLLYPTRLVATLRL
jgi:soluble P-type ATPase